jgi:hypothetical protein
MVGKAVEFEAQTGDDEGLIRDFNPRTGLCKIQFFKSNKIITVRRDKFETSENLIRKREKRAREAVLEYEEKLAAEMEEAAAPFVEWQEGQSTEVEGDGLGGARSRAIVPLVGQDGRGHPVAGQSPGPTSTTAEAGGVEEDDGGEHNRRLLLSGGGGGHGNGGDDDEEEEDEEPPLGDFGAAYLGGDDRYKLIAQRYPALSIASTLVDFLMPFLLYSIQHAAQPTTTCLPTPVQHNDPSI